MSRLASSWERAWRELGLSPAPGLRERVLEAYSEPQRHYHAVQHLEECLSHFDEVHDLAHHPGEVAIALWFHDAIYDPQRKDNEAQSAAWALEALTEADATVRERVRDLILATRHDAIPADADQRLLVDIDLAILGAAPARFAEYDAQIRAEYRWVPRLVYGLKRKAVLKGFLRREPIFATDWFRSRYETQARANLAAATA